MKRPKKVHQKQKNLQKMMFQRKKRPKKVRFVYETYKNKRSPPENRERPVERVLREENEFLCDIFIKQGAKRLRRLAVDSQKVSREPW